MKFNKGIIHVVIGILMIVVALLTWYYSSHKGNSVNSTSSSTVSQNSQ